MPGWLGALGSALGFVVFLGAVVVYLRGSKDKGTIETLERSNSALVQRVGVLEDEARVNAEERARLSARVTSLERENTSLLAQRPSAEVISDIRSQLTDLANKQGVHNAEVKTLLMAIATTLGERDDSGK